MNCWLCEYENVENFTPPSYARCNAAPCGLTYTVPAAIVPVGIDAAANVNEFGESTV